MRQGPAAGCEPVQRRLPKHLFALPRELSAADSLLDWCLKLNLMRQGYSICWITASPNSDVFSSLAFFISR